MIDLLLPSRGRRDRLMQMIISAFETADDHRNINVILFLDEDDSHNYGPMQSALSTKYIIGKSDVLSKLWNQCFEAGKGNIVMHCSDDIIFESKGWDTIVEEHFAKQEIICLYGRDGHQDRNCPTHSFISRKAANIVGNFLPPYFTADGNDLWLREVYAGLGRLVYDERIVTRHLHVNVDAKYDDATYQLAATRRQAASAMYEEKKHEIKEWIEKLKPHL